MKKHHVILVLLFLLVFAGCTTGSGEDSNSSKELFLTLYGFTLIIIYRLVTIIIWDNWKLGIEKKKYKVLLLSITLIFFGFSFFYWWLNIAGHYLLPRLAIILGIGFAFLFRSHSPDYDQKNYILPVFMAAILVGINFIIMIFHYFDSVFWIHMFRGYGFHLLVYTLPAIGIGYLLAKIFKKSWLFAFGVVVSYSMTINMWLALPLIATFFLGYFLTNSSIFNNYYEKVVTGIFAFCAIHVISIVLIMLGDYFWMVRGRSNLEGASVLIVPWMILNGIMCKSIATVQIENRI